MYFSYPAQPTGKDPELFRGLPEYIPPSDDFLLHVECWQKQGILQHQYESLVHDMLAKERSDALIHAQEGTVAQQLRDAQDRIRELEGAAAERERDMKTLCEHLSKSYESRQQVQKLLDDTMTSNWDAHQKSNELQVKLWQNELQLKERYDQLVNLQHEFDQHKDQSAVELANVHNAQVKLRDTLKEI
ncbi:hypothetical protein L227DRAFT_617608 [Lentinus tigrinus ALCF2SS1-6]|uniref:Uncharacterized protein n=1 Tax=Lentinus tigrinus ALCF2SS1-6 TaxID=1328759 RepID=A0A5C2RQ90_9APHY|nr:hypothetical protein L227DRAFT_617608 [Lentinus tigrinus ALCF2SS1-6]